MNSFQHRSKSNSSGWSILKWKAQLDGHFRFCGWGCTWRLSDGQKNQLTQPTIVCVATYTAQNDGRNKKVISSFVRGGIVNHDRDKLYFLSVTECDVYHHLLLKGA